jgi:hypothetical protein
MHGKYAILIPMILSATIHVTVVQIYLEIGSSHGKVYELLSPIARFLGFLNDEIMY